LRTVFSESRAQAIVLARDRGLGRA
jgi:hypothetical protein